MSDEPTRVRAAVGRVCSEEPQMRACLERAGDTSPLDRLIAAARDGAELSELLDELHTALQRCGDAVGVFGPRAGLREWDLRHRDSGLRPVGVGVPSAVEVAFHCPQGTCSRDWQSDPAHPSSTPPTCRVYGKPLRWARLG
ncbi:MAG: hypothetical protein LC799_05595 [Actinobacteria bacterium]|nr:hypothetical protein [Actinomycetota bacterium]